MKLFENRIFPIVAGLSILLGLIGAAPDSAEAAPSRDRKKITKLSKETRKLRRTVRNLKLALANERRVIPPPAPFIEMVTIRDPGNSVDPEDGDASTGAMENFGAVSYVYSIGKYEVTMNQYVVFLNAVANVDSNGLYQPNVGTHPHVLGIQRDITAEGYSYSVIGSGERAMTNVSWFDAARFCNWLHNGRPTGVQDATTTEMGAYSLNGSSSGVFHKNPGAKFWIPSEDEWYKAAYYRPASAGPGGPVDEYYFYPTQSDVAPGNVIGSGANQANHRPSSSGKFSTTQTGGAIQSTNYLTDMGAYSSSPSFYGTFDQGGSVWEWNDGVFDETSGFQRGIRGGSWWGGEPRLHSSKRGHKPMTEEGNVIGFRIAGPADAHCP